jgi:hypothetical protein
MAKKRKRKYSKSSGEMSKTKCIVTNEARPRAAPAAKAARSRVENKQSPLAFLKPARRERKYRRKSHDQRVDVELM